MSADMVLIERLSGAMGEAYHWQHGPEATREIEEKGQGWPFSPSYWLLHLPKHDERIEGLYDEADQQGVFQVMWLNHEHEMWQQFRGKLPRFDRAYMVNVQEAWGDNPDIRNPDSVDGYSDPLMEYGGDVPEAADHLMRLWVGELLAGRLCPYDGYTGEKDPDGYFRELLLQAETDPAAHLSERGQPALL